MKIIKNIFFGTATLIVLSALSFTGFHYWSNWAKLKQFGQAKEFYHLVDSANQETLDLRAFRMGEWEEMLFWAPYQNICDYGITGYEAGNFNCSSSNDDGECYLLFIQANKLVFSIPVDRRKLDLTKSKLPNRLTRNEAVFSFQTKGDWPEVSVKRNP